jgi:succinoglycan biosynthesis protein ExoO
LNTESTQLVSVVMPAFNARSTIAQAIESVFRQTHSALELIVVDDASTDSTGELLASLRDPRLRTIRHPANAGEGASRNTAVAATAGEWIAMLDADDAWDPRRLERLLSFAPRGDDRTILADNFMHCYSAGGELRRWRRQWRGTELPFVDGAALLDAAAYLNLDRQLVKPLIPRRLLRESGVAHSSRIYGADTEFLIRLLKTGCRLLIVDEPLYFYRKAPGSMSDNPRRARILRGMFEELLGELEFSAAERAGIERRIERLRFEERYLPFLADAKGRRWRQALGRAAAEPRLLAEFLRRLPESVRYRMQVALHGGTTR